MIIPVSYIGVNKTYVKMQKPMRFSHNAQSKCDKKYILVI